MLEELRLYPRASAAQAGGCPAARAAASDPGMAGSRLSTAFAERPRPGSTGARRPIHSAVANSKEVVG
jgi:hypothetical protein